MLEQLLTSQPKLFNIEKNYRPEQYYSEFYRGRP